MSVTVTKGVACKRFRMVQVNREGVGVKEASVGDLYAGSRVGHG